jgi:hypothetical protein
LLFVKAHVLEGTRQEEEEQMSTAQDMSCDAHHIPAQEISDQKEVQGCSK